MMNRSLKMGGAILIAIVLLVALNGCETWREDCKGEIIVENKIPDTTLYMGGEDFTRDISELPVVFIHTEKEITLLEVMAVDNDIALAGTRINEDSKRYIIHVKARREGSTEISVSARDGCLDYSVSTTFNVTVIDTTNN